MTVEPDETEKNGKGKSVKKRMPSGFSTIRDLISFFFGLGVIVHEVFLSVEVEAYAVGIGLAMMGLPLVFGADERKAK